MIHQSSKRSLRIQLLFLMTWIAFRFPATIAAESGSYKNTTLVVSNISCSSCFKNVQELLTNLDHTSIINVVNYPGILKITHHPSLKQETIIAALGNSGYSAKVAIAKESKMLRQNKQDIEFSNPKQFRLPRQSCGASSQTWKKLIKRFRYGRLSKPNS